MIEPTSPLPESTTQLEGKNGTPSSEIAEYSIDQFLLNALTNPRDRIFILKLDKDIEKFIKDAKRARLEFPPMSSYHRLIIHRAAQYFKVDHIVVDVEPGKRAVVLIKSQNSRIPVLRFSDLVEQHLEEPANSQKNVKIMKRQSPPSPLSYPVLQEEFKKVANDDSKTAEKSMEKSKSASVIDSVSKTNSNAPPMTGVKVISKPAPPPSHETPSAVPQITIMKKKDRTYEQREEEYAKARARIFGSESSNPKPEATSSDEDSNASVDKLDSPRNPSSGTTSPTNPNASLSPEMDRKSPKDSKKNEDVSKGPRLNTGSISGHRSNGSVPKPKMDHAPPIPSPVVYPNGPSGGQMPWMWGQGNPPTVNTNFVPQELDPQVQNHFPVDYDYQNVPNPSWDYLYAPVYVQPIPPNPTPTNINDKQNNSNNNRNKPSRLQKQNSGNSNGNPNPPVFSPPRTPTGVPPLPMPPMGMPAPFPNGEEMPPGNYWPPYYPGPQFQMGFIYSEMGMPPYPYYGGMDYERRPPKSTELFDPNAPSLGKPQRHSGGLLEREMRKLNVNFPRSPSYESFFGFAPANGPRGQRNPNAPSEARTQSELDKPIPVAPLQMDHILEICGVARGTNEGDTFLNSIKQHGGIIKQLDDKTIIAVFPNAPLAKQALHSIKPHGNMSVRVWKAPVVATPNPGTLPQGMNSPEGGQLPGSKDNPSL